MDPTAVENLPLIDLSSIKDDDAKRKQSEALGLRTEHDINSASARSMIFKSARDGRADALSCSLDNDPDGVNAEDSDKMSPLHYSARYGHVEAVSLLIDKGADVKRRNYDGDTPLHLVAKYCKDNVSQEDLQKYSKIEETRAAKIINLLVENGAEVDVKNNFGMSPLHFAAMKSNTVAIKKLLQKSADVNALDVNKNTPLLLACIHGTVEVVEILLHSRCNVFSKDQLNNTVYHIAALRGDPELLELLLRKGGRGANSNGLETKNHEGKTPLRMAVEGNHPETLRVILKYEQQNSTKWHSREEGLMHYVAGRGFLTILKELVKAGGNQNELDSMQRLPLHEAARYNQKESVEYLLEPSSIEVRDQQGRTPLAVATSQDGIDAVKVLLDNGANVETQDDEEATAIFIGAKYNALKCVDYILNYIRNREASARDHNISLRNLTKITHAEEMVNRPDHNQMSPMHIVSVNGYIEMMRLLYNHGAVVNCINEDEETALHLASSKGETLAVRQLLEWDRRLLLHKDEMGNSSLHLAARGGHDLTCNVLLEAGAEKEARNSYQQTPLMMAVQYNQLSTAQQLVWRAAQINNSGDAKGVLHIAAENGNEAITRFLLDSGASIDRLDLENKTALDVAVEGGHREVVQALLENSQWRLLMTPSDELPVGRHKSTRDTPLRRLMTKFPDLAYTVFDKTSNNDFKSPGHCIHYDFELLDDTYMVPTEDGQYLDGSIKAYNKQFRLIDNAKTYNDDYDIIAQNHPLKLMANAERLSLLRHPLSVALLKHKWNRLGRYVYYFALSIYITFISLITFYVTHTPAPFNIPVGDNDFEDFSGTFTSDNTTCPNVIATRPHPMIKTIIIFLALLQLLKEGFQLLQRRLAYVSLENAIECFIYASAIITVIDLNKCSENTGIKMNWQWLLAATCTFTAWMNLLLMIRKLPRFGIFVVMFFDIVKTFSKFSIIFFLFIFAFSTSFYVIMQNRPEFSTMGSSLMKTTVMMIGEFEFTSIFHGDQSAHVERLFGHAVAYPLFFFFCVIMTILLMNLLVGLAVDDIKSVQEKAELKRLCMQVELVLQVEASIPYVRRIVARSGYAFFPNNVNFWKKLRNRFGYDASAEMLPEDATSGETEMSEALRSTLQHQKARLENLQSNIDVMYEKQVTLEKLVKSLAKGLNIDIQAEEKDG